MRYFISFDVGGTSIKHGLVDEQGKVVERGSFMTYNTRQENLDGLVKAVRHYQNSYTVDAIGVSAPGIVRADGYMITGGAIDSFFEFNFAQTLQEMTGLPTHVENDANAAAIAERWLGNAQGVQNYVCLVLGTGIGMGIVINGVVFRGAHGMAGEVGWNIIHDVDLTQDLEAASLNYHASVVSGLVRRYNASLKLAFPNATYVSDARDILALAHEDDRIAAPIYRDFLMDVSTMVLNLFGNFDPEVILIGGGISANDQFMVDLHAMVDECLARHKALNGVKDRVLGQVKPAGLRNDAGLLGAVYPLVRDAKKG